MPPRWGKLEVCQCQKWGKDLILLNDVNYVPVIHNKLLRLSISMKVFKLTGKTEQIKLEFKNLEYFFIIKSRVDQESYMGYALPKVKICQVSYAKSHLFIAHNYTVATKSTMK